MKNKYYLVVGCNDTNNNDNHFLIYDTKSDKWLNHMNNNKFTQNINARRCRFMKLCVINNDIIYFIGLSNINNVYFTYSISKNEFNFSPKNEQLKLDNKCHCLIVNPMNNKVLFYDLFNLQM